LPPPPDERSTAREQQELRKHAVGDDATALERVRYWNSGSPPHRWNERLAELIVRDDVGNPAGTRAFAMLNIAIHDALIAAWDSKYAYRRPRPSEMDARLVPEVTVPRSPSYPCEHAVAAGAAVGILAHLFPAHAESLAAAAHEAAWSRVVAGAVYPSDSKAGLTLGRAVAARVIESVKEDRAITLELAAMPRPRWSTVHPIGGLEVLHENRIAWSSAWPTVLAQTEEAEVSLHHRLNEEIRRRVAVAGLEGNAPLAARAYALAHVAHHVEFIASQAGRSRGEIAPVTPPRPDTSLARPEPIAPAGPRLLLRSPDPNPTLRSADRAE
jgi:PAP2 superfamily